MNTIHTSQCYECTADTSAQPVRSRMVSFIYALVTQLVESTADVPPMCRWFESSQARQITSRDSSHLSQFMPAGILTASLAFF